MRLGAPPVNWWRRKAPRSSRGQCFQKKTDALNAFRDANIHAIENWGGLDRPESPVEFEAVNHKYGRAKRFKPATTLAEAFWLALPQTRPPYCLEDIDLEALNDTDAGRMVGGFKLPDWYFEAKMAQEQTAYYRPPSRRDDETVTVTIRDPQGRYVEDLDRRVVRRVGYRAVWYHGCLRRLVFKSDGEVTLGPEFLRCRDEVWEKPRGRELRQLCADKKREYKFAKMRGQRREAGFQLAVARRHRCPWLKELRKKR